MSAGIFFKLNCAEFRLAPPTGGLLVSTNIDAIGDVIHAAVSFDHSNQDRLSTVLNQSIK